MARKPTTATYRRKAERLWSQVIHARGREQCEARGWVDPTTGWTNDCSGRMEAAHIIRRRANGTRTDLANGVLLCAMHHKQFDEHDQGQMRIFVDDKFGEGTYDTLRQRREEGLNGHYGIVYWREECERLQEVLARL